MSIAIITSPANAISNLTDLVTEVRDEMERLRARLDGLERSLADLDDTPQTDA